MTRVMKDKEKQVQKRKRIDKEREFVIIRGKALDVALWEHAEDDDVKKALAGIEKAKDKVRNAEAEIPELKNAVAEAEATLNALLEKYIPEGLRKVEK